jgi:GH25 family lysozyme M1 (1,4-beta-N-acetylmuramidase)
VGRAGKAGPPSSDFGAPSQDGGRRRLQRPGGKTVKTRIPIGPQRKLFNLTLANSRAIFMALWHGAGFNIFRCMHFQAIPLGARTELIFRGRVGLLTRASLGLIIVLGVSRAEGQRPLGTDVSHYQGTINWTTVKNAGITFAWTKATESTGYTDPYFTINQNNARAVGIPIGAYHFARPSANPNLTGANSADSEAAHYWNVVSNYVNADGLSMIPMLDWEDTGATNGAGFTTAQMSAWVNQWCNTVSNYARLKGVSGLKPIVYTGVWYSTPASGANNYPGLNTSVTNWPSWIAAYPLNPNPQTGGPSSSFPWPTWNFWQYADTNASGGDSDVFKGTASGLTSYLVGNQGLPFIFSQPSNRYADVGGSIKLSAGAGGAAPLRYQWRFNGVNMATATNSSVSLANLQAANAGNYAVVVTNTFGATTSSVALLTMNGLFTPVFSDNFDTNSAANWTLSQSTNNNTRATFAYDYSGYGIPSAPNSTGGTTRGVKFEANYTGAGVAALNISPIGQSFSGNYRLHYDMWINANGPFPAGGTGSTQLQTAGLGTTGNKVEWNSGAPDGVFFAIDGEGQATDTSPDIRAYIGATLQNTNSGVYVGGTNTSIRRCSDPYYSNVFPGGQTAPAAQGQSGALDVGTVGFAWRDVVINKTGNVIEWFIDGLKICSVTNTLTSSNIFVGYWDPFSSLSDNPNLSFALVDNLRVEVPAVAPSITTQPLPVAVKVTSNATFTVSASGIPAPGYQWRFNGTNITGANGSSYTRNNAQYADAGNYNVLVTNIVGTTTSSNALLSILTAAPAQLQTVSWVPADASLQIRIMGDPGATYYVQSSTNLVDWTPLTNVTIITGTFDFSITGLTNDDHRFFRARSGP